MSYLRCVVPVCPVRAEAAHRSEQVSQLLFGETAELIESSGDFVKIKCSYDNYEGWCQLSQLQEMKQSSPENFTVNLCADWVNEIVLNGKKMYLPFASVITTSTNQNVAEEVQNFKYSGKILTEEDQLFTEENLIKIAYTFINTPYLWGGRSVFGIDCSGFAQLVFKCLNISLLRDASQQATQGEAIGFLMEAKFGDLAFFDNEAGKITHVGILLNTDTIIHASGKVRIDTIDNFGIVSSDTRKRTHTLRVIKRMINGN
jgi:hypothetical protein